MFDGINLRAGFYSLLIFIIFIIKDTYSFYSLIIIYTLMLFLFYNYQNKSFLGDSGTQVLAFIISYILIKSHNIEKIFYLKKYSLFYLFQALICLDFFVKNIKWQNPFHADIDHIHHLITKELAHFMHF